jgi:hypothetical protein
MQRPDTQPEINSTNEPIQSVGPPTFWCRASVSRNGEVIGSQSVGFVEYCCRVWRSNDRLPVQHPTISAVPHYVFDGGGVYSAQIALLSCLPLSLSLRFPLPTPTVLPSPSLKHRPPPCEQLLWGEQSERCSRLVRRPAGCGRDNRRRKFGAWSYRFLKAGAVAPVRLGHIAGFCRSGLAVFGCDVRFFFALDAHRQPPRGIVHTIWCVPWCDGGFVSQNRIVVAS